MKKWLLLISLNIASILTLAQGGWKDIYSTDSAIWNSGITLIDSSVLETYWCFENKNNSSILKIKIRNSKNGITNIKCNQVLSDSIKISRPIIFSNGNSQVFLFNSLYRGIFKPSASAKNFSTYLQKINKINFSISEINLFDTFFTREILDIKILNSNRIIISGNQAHYSYFPLGDNPYAIHYAILDTNFNILFKDTFVSNTPWEQFVNMELDKNSNVYLCGAFQHPPFYINKYQIVIRKIDSNGNLLKSTILPRRLHSKAGYIVNIADTVQDKFVVINAQYNKHDKDTTNSINVLSNQELRLAYLDTNLNTYRIDSIRTPYCFYLYGVRKLHNGNILLHGIKQANYVDSSLGYLTNDDFYGWAAVIDTNGKFIWDHLYNFRAGALHYLFHSAENPQDGSIYLGGSVTGTSATLPQAALIFKIDSNGCLDTAFCYPMGIHEVEVLTADNFYVYPNPAVNSVTVVFNQSRFAGGTAQLYNAAGIQVLAINNVTNQQVIDVGKLPSGTYYLRYNNKGFVGSRKVMINNE